MELQRRLLSSSWVGEVRVSRHVSRCGFRCLRSIQGFNDDDDDCSSRALVLCSTRTKTFWNHRQGQAGSGRGVATAARRRLVLVAVVIVWESWNLNVFFIMFEMICNSAEL